MKIEEVFTLFDDEAVREKLTVMTKWDAMVDDSRNKGELLGNRLEEFLQLGKSYRVTIEEDIAHSLLEVLSKHSVEDLKSMLESLEEDDTNDGWFYITKKLLADLIRVLRNEE